MVHFLDILIFFKDFESFEWYVVYNKVLRRRLLHHFDFTRFIREECLMDLYNLFYLFVKFRVSTQVFHTHICSDIYIFVLFSILDPGFRFCLDFWLTIRSSLRNRQNPTDVSLSFILWLGHLLLLYLSLKEYLIYESFSTQSLFYWLETLSLFYPFEPTDSEPWFTF